MRGRICAWTLFPYLENNGWLMFEHGWDQGEAVGKQLHQAGYKEVFLHRDLSGQDRISGGRWASHSRR